MAPNAGDDQNNQDQPGFELFEKTKHTGELSSAIHEGAGFARHAVIGGSYRVIEFIGEGGMGLVYKVEHIVMNKVLALKVLKTEQVSENVWKRFQLEAQAISRLDHPNIIKIYDMNQTADGRPFYTMELLVGQSLADYLQEQKRLPVAQALPLFRQVCSALAYAHERGIIHRDIKPGNIMLLDEVSPGAGSRVKIVDFGIVKLVDERALLGQGLTMQGEVFGSPLYMSPEQCSGSKLDGRADMYSVGVSMFQALTGRPPLVGRTAAETTIMHHTTAPPTLAEVGGIEYPPALEKLVAKMLAKAPDERYNSLSEVAQALLSIEGRGSRSDSQTLAPSQNKKNILSPQAADVNSETGGTVSTLDASVVKPLVVVGVVFTVVLMVLFLLFNSKLFEQTTTMAPTPKEVDHVGKIIAEADRFTSLAPSENGENDKEIELFLRERKEPYFTVAQDGSATFSFPEHTSIGTIMIADSRGQKEHQAKGKFETGPWRELCFTASGASFEHPQLLKFFPANSLTYLKFLDLKPRSQDLFNCIAQQKNLINLQLGDTSINESDFKVISALTKLRTLVIECYDIGPKALLDCKLLHHLDGLGLIGLSKGTPLLESLVSSKNLRYLILTNAKLSKKDVAIIAKMTHLKQLTLNGTDIDDNDVQTLSTLRDLEFINLSATKITDKSTQTLLRFHHLKERILSPKVNGSAAPF